ncbi:hypothetical protein GCM10027160_44070 [Streptomyces calidiresistens]
MVRLVQRSEMVGGQSQDDANLIPGYARLSLLEVEKIRRDHPHDSVPGKDWVPLLRGLSGDFCAVVWGDHSTPGVAGGMAVLRGFMQLCLGPAANITPKR